MNGKRLLEEQQFPSSLPPKCFTKTDGNSISRPTSHDWEFPIWMASTDLEAALLNHRHSDDDLSSDILELDTPEKPRDPLYVLIFYGLSLLVSIGGLGCGLWGFVITSTGPFGKDSRNEHLENYLQNFLGMQSVLVLVYTRVSFHTLVRLMLAHSCSSTLYGAVSISSLPTRANRPSCGYLICSMIS